MAAVDDAGEGGAEGWGEDAELIIDEGNSNTMLEISLIDQVNQHETSIVDVIFVFFCFQKEVLEMKKVLKVLVRKKEEDGMLAMMT